MISGHLAYLGALPDWAPHWLGFLSADTLLGWFPPEILVLVICIVIFIETGLLFPFLPGDSLLFVGGLLVATGQIHEPLWLLCLTVSACAFAGDQLAFFIGSKAGRRLFNNPDARILKPKYLEKTDDFFAKYGGRTIVIARFVPIIRTFAAVVAGTSALRYRVFVGFDVIGAISWGSGVTVIGFFLGQIPFVHNNIELILVAMVFVSVIPIIIEYVRHRGKNSPETASSNSPGTAAPDVPEDS
ncbi:DedA family protein [Spelaeicoccus albus]|nr:VTT domain-containing protein [Spelaeicoccus albus]